jgi:hypothetical protein
MIIPRGKRPVSYLVTYTGQPRHRIVTIDGAIIHRCLPDLEEPLD